jgi:hypothetical protein
MKRGIVGAFVAAAIALTLGAGAVLARAAPISTEVDLKGFGLGPSLAQAEGLVSSPNDKCVSRRKVKIFVLYASDPPELIGADSTSHNGAFFVTGNPSSSSSPTALKAKVLRKTIGRRHHHRLCKADSDTQSVID